VALLLLPLLLALLLLLPTLLLLLALLLSCQDASCSTAPIGCSMHTTRTDSCPARCNCCTQSLVMLTVAFTWGAALLRELLPLLPLPPLLLPATLPNPHDPFLGFTAAAAAAG
jgi:hypothetical protein